jgi:hypothetical protein
MTGFPIPPDHLADPADRRGTGQVSATVAAIIKVFAAAHIEYAARRLRGRRRQRLKLRDHHLTMILVYHQTA